MKLEDLLIGKTVLLMTNARVKVPLKIVSAKENSHSVDIGPSTAENDWWPEQREWKTLDVVFENGHTESYTSLSALDFFD